MRESPELLASRVEMDTDYEGIGLTSEQLDRLYEVKQVLLGLPDVRGDQDELTSTWAIEAAWKQMAGQEVGLASARSVFQQARADLYGKTIGAVLGGMSEAEAARRSGLDRMTVRRLLGKR